VELARDAGANGFLRVDQAFGELTGSFVAGSERSLVRAKGLLDAPPLRSLGDKSGDQHQLRGDDHERGDDVSTIRVPRGRRCEPDFRFLRQRRRIDVPAFQLPPIDDRREPRAFDRDVVGWCAADDLSRHFSDPEACVVPPAHDPAHHA
jgi:hypothetical protein